MEQKERETEVQRERFWGESEGGRGRETEGKRERESGGQV